MPSSSPRQPGLRRRHSLTDRDQVDDVPARSSASDAPICLYCLFEKTRMAVPAPAAADLPRARCILPLACFSSGPRSDVATAGIQDGGVPKAIRAGAMRRDGRTRIGRVVQEARDPWQIDRCRRGDGHPNFSHDEDTGPTARMPVHARIHPIAIRRSRPWLEGRAPA